MIATGITIFLLGKGSMFETSSLSDFASVSCSTFVPAGVSTRDASAFASDAVPTFMAAKAPRLIKEIRASQTVLIIHKVRRGAGGNGHISADGDPAQTKRPPEGGQKIEGVLPCLGRIAVLMRPPGGSGCATISVFESGDSVSRLRSFPLCLQPRLETNLKGSAARPMRSLPLS